jgi:hypothetical protein
LIDWFIVFNATFSNVSAISWRPVLVVEEAGVLGENHRPWASNWWTLSLATASRVHFFFLIWEVQLMQFNIKILVSVIGVNCYIK